MNVEFWYKKPTCQSMQKTRPTSKGLKVEGVKYKWAEVEEKYGMSGKRFAKRYHANPDWSMEDLLTKPVQKQRRKTRGKNLPGTAEDRREYRSTGNNHLPEQLEANKIVTRMPVCNASTQSESTLESKPDSPSMTYKATPLPGSRRLPSGLLSPRLYCTTPD